MSAPTPVADLSGRCALVVGASRGIGASAATALAARGARVAVSARTAASLHGVADQVRATGAEAHVVAADVTDPDSAQRVLDEVTEGLGPVDVLVYATGQSAVGRFEDLSDDDWRRLYEVNVLGAVRLARAVLPHMRDQGWGRVINVASTAAKYGSKLQSPYNATKHALLGLTRCLALETAGTGITVNAVCPGFVDTEMVQQAVPLWATQLGVPESAVIPGLLSRVPLGQAASAR